MNRKTRIAAIDAELAAFAVEAKDATDDDLIAIGEKVAPLTAEKAGLVAEQAKADAARKLIDSITPAEAVAEVEAPGVKSVVTNVRERKTVADLFIESQSYQAFKKAFPSGQVDKGSVRIAADVKTLITRAVVGGLPTVSTPIEPAAVQNYQYWGRPLSLLDAGSTATTESPVIPSFTATLTNAAAVVAEGVQKHESSLTWTPNNLTVIKHAHFIPTTTEALADYGQLRSLIDDALIYGLSLTVEDYVASALAATSGLGVQPFVTDIFATIRKAKTVASLYGRPNGVLLSPGDAETIDLARENGATGAYLGAGPFAGGNSTVWQLPMYVSAAIPDGFAYVGDLKQGVYYEREGATIATGWTGTQFTENELTILAESRGVFGVRIAPAIVKAATAAGGSGEGE